VAVPFARQIAAFNRRVTNPILDPLVWHLPGFGRVETIGRRSGRRRIAPMMGFPSRDGHTITFALTYGAEANWVRNAVAAGRFWYSTRTDGIVELVEPSVYRDTGRAAMPRLVRIALGVLRVDEFLVATVAGQAGTAAR
jgi:hypothetical protein